MPTFDFESLDAIYLIGTKVRAQIEHDPDVAFTLAWIELFQLAQGLKAAMDSHIQEFFNEGIF